MKAHSIVATAAAVLAGTVFAGSAGAGVLDHRQVAQQVRIAQGVASGALTARETFRLESRAASIARQEAYFRATGQGLSGRERLLLNHRLDHLSGAIARQKHDAQRRR